MIRNLSIKGFKSLLDNHIEFNYLNILTGLNSSGKSSIIQALRILNRFSNQIGNPLINGHGDAKELQNPYSSTPFIITSEFGDYKFSII